MLLEAVPLVETRRYGNERKRHRKWNQVERKLEAGRQEMALIAKTRGTLLTCSPRSDRLRVEIGSNKAGY